MDYPALFMLSMFYPSIVVLGVSKLPVFRDAPINSLMILFPALIYLGTIIVAFHVSHRLQFHKYKLSVVKNSSIALLGCLLFWIFFFPWFVINWILVARKKVPLLNTENNKIELKYIIIIGAWSLIWIYMAFMHSFLHTIPFQAEYNRNSAYQMLIAYHNAQMKFRSGEANDNDADSIRDKGVYCNNLRALYYGFNENNEQLKLIPKNLADAFINNSSSDIYKAYNGYIFSEDPYVLGNNLWDEDFALVAYPQYPGKSGYEILWIGKAGKVFSLYIPYDCEEFKLLSIEQSPLYPDCQNDWMPLSVYFSYILNE